MKTLLFPAIALLSAALAVTSAVAQPRGGVPYAPIHAINPSISLSAPATSPLQQQVQDDYAAQLMHAQRDLLQQNPSGTTRQELEISHELNGFTTR
jgi:hypothetical protein